MVKLATRARRGDQSLSAGPMSLFVTFCHLLSPFFVFFSAHRGLGWLRVDG